VSGEFKSLASILRELRELRDGAAIQPAAISPLIAAIDVPEPAAPRDDRLFAARLAERLESAVRTLLREIAAEVLGRELLLAPIEIDAIVARLRERYALEEIEVDASADGDVILTCAAGEIDASLGRRLRAAIEAAS